MSNLTKAIQGEISRIARKEIKVLQLTIHEKTTKLQEELKKSTTTIASLKLELNRLKRELSTGSQETQKKLPKAEKPKICDTDFAEKLRLFRVKTGFSQNRLAKLLGVTRLSVILWEGGRRYPAEDNQKKLDQLINKYKRK